MKQILLPNTNNIDVITLDNVRKNSVVAAIGVINGVKRIFVLMYDITGYKYIVLSKEKQTLCSTIACITPEISNFKETIKWLYETYKIEFYMFDNQLELYRWVVKELD